jgi:hypothetical protein
MNEQTIIQQIPTAALTDDELSQVAGGGDGGPGGPGDNNGAVDPDLKATPVLF